MGIYCTATLQQDEKVYKYNIQCYLNAHHVPNLKKCLQETVNLEMKRE